MKSDNKIYAVEKAVYTCQLDITELSAASPYPEYMEYFESAHHTILAERAQRDLTCINDIALRRRLVEFLLDSMDPDIINPPCYCQYRYRAFFSLLDSYPQWFSVPYNEFCSMIVEKIKNENLMYGRYAAFIHTFLDYCKKRDNTDDPFSNDIWDVKSFNLPPERTFTNHMRYLYFDKIKNQKNKFYMKKYIEYCLRNTDNSLNTVHGKLSGNALILNLRESPIDMWTQEDADFVAEEVRTHYPVRSTLTQRMMYFYGFIDFLIIADYLQDNPMKKYKELARMGPYNYKTTAVDQYVVNQIFQVLGSISDQRLVLIFLLIYCTGMRISEACAIPYDCISKTESGCFISFYSSKMRKQCTSVIPQSLYDMIQQYRSMLTKHTAYLFPSEKKRLSHYSTQTFYEHFSKELTDFDIRNADGTPYHFSPHSFRHLLAVRMREQNIPFQVIQEQLHHHSPDMTLAYIEYIDRTRIAKMESFINADGNKAEFQPEIQQTESKSYAEYLRKYINAQILPNGVCARPVKLGKCPYSGGCLSCPEFRTSARFLPTHKQQLARVQNYIAIAEKEGWLPQIESNRAIEEQLIRLIRTLEDMEDDNDHTKL